MTTPGGISIRIETALGAIGLLLDDAHAPLTMANMLRMIDAGMYDGGRFHRTVRSDNNANTNLTSEAIGARIDPSADRRQLPNDTIAIEVIQGGINPDRSAGLGAPILLERTRDTGLHHLDGTISMARLTPDSAVADFFICINDQPSLDFGGMRNPDGQGFAAFGQVTTGMDIVRAIQAQPSDGQTLSPSVAITRIVRA